MPKLTVKKRGGKKKPSSQQKAVRRRQSGGSEVLKLANLIADPCTAPLVAPQYGASDGGYLAKFASNTTLDTGTDSANAGYVVWFPDFCGRAGGDATSPGNNGNLYMFGTAFGSGAPTNTAAAPLGGDSIINNGAGAFLEDPAWDFTNSATVMDARTIAACMKLMYIGRNDALSGRIAYLENVPREAITNGLSGSPASVDALFRYANTITRMPMDSCENKFRPGDGSDSYRTPQHRSAESNTDYAFVQGDSAVTTLGSGSASGVGMGIGFAWDGMADDTSLAFDFLKCVEWRPEITSGLMAPHPTQAEGGANIVSKALSYLDKHHHGWQRTAINAAKSGAATLAQLAFSGPDNTILRIAGELGALAL